MEIKVRAYDLEGHRFNLRNLRKRSESIYSYTFEDNEEMLLESLASMFNFYDFPEGVNTKFMPIYSLTYGMGCVARTSIFPSYDEDYEFCVAQFKMVGMPDVNGLGRDAIVTTFNGLSTVIKNWKKSEDIQPFFLNKIYTPDMNIPRVASLLTEADASIRTILKLARYNKILGCSDSTTKNALEEALKNIDNGNIATFVADFISDPLTGAASEPFATLDITDVRNNDMIQYLTNFEEDVLRMQFFNKYGLDTAGAAKMAQQSEDEINSGSNRAMVVPHSRLECWKEFEEACNKKFGWNCRIEFSECWQNELAKCEKDLPADEEPEEINEEIEESEAEANDNDTDVEDRRDSEE